MLVRPAADLTEKKNCCADPLPASLDFFESGGGDLEDRMAYGFQSGSDG